MMRSDPALRVFVLSMLQTAWLSAAEPETFQPPVTSLIISENGQSVIEGSQAGLRIRRWQDLFITSEHSYPCAQIHDCSLSVDQSKLTVVGGDPGQHAFVGVYSWPALEKLWSRRFAEDVLYAGSFDVSGKLLALAGHDHSIYLLDAVSGNSVRALTGHSKPVRDLCWLGDGRTLLSCSIDQTIRIWDSQSGKIVRSLNNHTRPVTEMAVRPGDGALPMIVSAGEDKTVRLWQPTIGRLVRFSRLKSPAEAVVWTRDGTRVLAGSRNGKLHSVVTDTLEIRAYQATSNGWINCVAVHPNEMTAVVGTSAGDVSKVVLTQ